MKKKLISLMIDTGSYRSFIDRILNLASTGKSSYICVANVHMMIEAYQDAKFADVVNHADMVTADGVPLTWGLKLIHHIKQDRVAGMDLLPDLLSEMEKQNMGAYFYGGTQLMLDKTEEYVHDLYPDLNISGLYSPPFRALSAAEDQEIFDNINASGAKVIFVALGCPKQEKWMAKAKGHVNGCMIGIGGALPVMIGLQKRAPIAMQRIGMEWFYRLMQEPKRLFMRYFVTNTTFIWLLFKARLNRASHQEN